MDWKPLLCPIGWLSLFCLITTSPVFADSLSLAQAEHAALSQAPELRMLHAKSAALQQSAIAAGQLSDPKLTLGAVNVPLDTFDLNQEAMTQMQVGVQQAFPRSHSLRYRSLKTRDLAQVKNAQGEVMRAQILQDVRLRWLGLYYWLRAKRIVLAQKSVFHHLVKVTESLLANNKAQQKDVIRAQLELTALDDQLITVNQEINTARAKLLRWVGPDLAKHANPVRLPRWAQPPPLSQLRSTLLQHPELQTDKALIAASQAGVKLAEQQFKPGFTVGMAYGFRQGRNSDGGRRADFLTAQMKIDLPLFTRNRQSRELKASEANMVATEEGRDSHYRRLMEALKTDYITWSEQRRSSQLYRRKLIPEAKQYSQATLVAYQNNQTDFPTLARAYVRELDAQLAGLKALVDRDRAQAHLLYIQGK